MTQSTIAEEQQQLAEQRRTSELLNAAQALKDHYMTLITDKQLPTHAEEQALQATLQQLATSFSLPPSS